MSSRDSSVSRVSSISEGKIQRGEGHIYVANSTDCLWQVEFLTNEYEIGSGSIGADTIGPHQISKMACVCIREFFPIRGNPIRGTSRRIPIVIKVTKKNYSLSTLETYKRSVKNKSGLIITETGLVDAKKRRNPFSKSFSSGSPECWKPKGDENRTYDPHVNLLKGEQCQICKVQSLGITAQQSSRMDVASNLASFDNLDLSSEMGNNMNISFC